MYINKQACKERVTEIENQRESARENHERGPYKMKVQTDNTKILNP